MKKLFLTLGVVSLLLIGGFYLLNNHIYNRKQNQEPGNISKYRATLSGELVCLPDKNTNEPQTLECTFGIKTDSNEYYAVDFNLLAKEGSNLEIGNRFTASGIITPVEMLSSDYWQKYPVAGIFSLTDSIKKL